MTTHDNMDQDAGKTKIVPFLFENERLVRVVERDGAPWFVAADVCAALGIQQASPAVEKLDADEKGVTIIHTLGGEQEVLIISEGGLYTLVIRSHGATKPGTVAHRFRKWVTSVVLPTIRQTGRYEAPRPVASDEELQTADTIKLRKVNTVIRCFGERAGAQMWVHLKMEWVPAMAQALRQGGLFDEPPPGSVTVTVMPNGMMNGGSAR